jgi:hypothetical protein
LIIVSHGASTGRPGYLATFDAGDESYKLVRQNPASGVLSGARLKEA